MKKKSNKKTTPKNKNRKEIAHLETLVKYSLNAVDNRSKELDSIFMSQVNKLRNKIKQLERK